jgi:hypothetical protein
MAGTGHGGAGVGGRTAMGWGLIPGGLSVWAGHTVEGPS